MWHFILKADSQQQLNFLSVKIWFKLMKIMEFGLCVGLCFVFSLFELCQASIGDNSPYFENCVYKCSLNNCSNGMLNLCR